MNRAFVQRQSGLVNPTTTAAEGLAKLGYEIIRFDQEDAESLPDDLDSIVVGFI